ncbi:septum formation inhibitor Maf [Mycetohabitans rhizoxinica]|uniref:Maf family protein n=1 Tax=Mycetohabitans rhizoxinica TaxID=412963 RepID=UPI0030CB3063
MSTPSSLDPAASSLSTHEASGANDACPATPRHSFIYLASQSPRRRALLEQIGVRFELLLAQEHEDAEALEAERPGESAQDYVVRVTLAKATAAGARRNRLLARQRDAAPAPILVADTTVALDDEILGKPSDVDHALQMLKRLAGREHRVLTAVALVGADATVTSALSVSRVWFAAVDDASLARYARSGEPFGKAGAYGIQGRAAEFVERIDGSYSGIMGLPLFETTALLRAARVAFQ